ncbi:MAG: iron ABC transporter permease [Treponema sp.]|nr:iron ABC transporter permease [Treponema sp.]
MNKKTKEIIFTASAFLLLALTFTASLLLGSQKLTPAQLAEAFTNSKSLSHTIIFSLRLPRTILALSAGALLSASGAAFQMYFRNSLAEPGIMGISSGATLGAVSAQAIGVSGILFGTLSPINVFAFAGAIFAGIIIILISQKQNGIGGGITLLLCGTALATFYAAVTSIILMTKIRQVNGLYYWVLGSFNGRGWTEVRFVIAPALISLTLLLFCSNKLDLLSGGERTAQALGLETKRLRTTILISASLAVSAAVCAGGTINFVGLIAPHIVRHFIGTKGKSLISVSMIFGAILLIISDTIARTAIAPAELPTGIITSLLGAPFFVSLIFPAQKKGIR